MAQQLTRNFCIIAHIDHGKSTLADRLLERTGSVNQREMVDQVLDTLDLERERGITIKLQAVRMAYTAADGQTYELNLIDTPGHVDFSYEVSRSLAACEGAILVVDAAQGIEAQTLATLYQAVEAGLALVPVVNKIDLEAAQPELVAQEIVEVTGLDLSKVIFASAKQGVGTDEILEAIIREVPPPAGAPERPLRALIFDSHYDPYRGVIVYVRVVDGEIRPRTRVRMMNTGKVHEVDEVGWFTPGRMPGERLQAGDVGYFTAGIKNVTDARVGDTVTLFERSASEPLPGYRSVKPMVFAGIFPTDSDLYPELKEALERFQLNDASLVFEPENSAALGFGFRCGFLGLLHMEIVQERLEREFGLDLITTAPTVQYNVYLKRGGMVEVDNPSLLPEPTANERIEEPFVRATVVTPAPYVGPMMELCQERRGSFRTLEHQVGERVLLEYDMPLAEIIHDFYDQLKSRSRGYASLDYEVVGFRPGDLVKLDILVSGQPVDALSMIVDRAKAQTQGRRLVERLKEIIPRQLFEVPIQAAIGGKVIARETISAMRKDVIAKCYGGDVTRKRKLLERQKEGKRRMKRVGNVEIPQEAFMAVLSLR
ncbi:translation elongation factor 4 [Candidatus Nephthysia bennettiae]|uniref:Elongation factor 4 n=1 Tax=Candidatus Nephthysia bennettiae TaxID=3127016 RepID=A0A934K456_9BACT|nr:elongation factor 4 [Candidatus Dormibacteraeota bacterium]MBJ7613608.1 elongation factor 4 [Candidatus Dormibacteraeota bacterium]